MQDHLALPQHNKGQGHKRPIEQDSQGTPSARIKRLLRSAIYFLRDHKQSDRKVVPLVPKGCKRRVSIDLMNDQGPIRKRMKLEEHCTAPKSIDGPIEVPEGVHTSEEDKRLSNSIEEDTDSWSQRLFSHRTRKSKARSCRREQQRQIHSSSSSPAQEVSSVKDVRGQVCRGQSSGS